MAYWLVFIDDILLCFVMSFGWNFWGFSSQHNINLYYFLYIYIL